MLAVRGHGPGQSAHSNRVAAPAPRPLERHRNRNHSARMYFLRGRRTLSLSRGEVASEDLPKCSRSDNAQTARTMSADGSSADLEPISDQNWLEQSATVLETQKDTSQSGAESTLTDAWRAFVRNEAITPTNASGLTNWRQSHRHVFSPSAPEASRSHPPDNPMHGMHGAPNLSPHRNQHNTHPVINLKPLPAPLPVSTTPNDALVSSSASVGAANTSPSHLAASTPSPLPSLSPSAAKSPTAAKLHGSQNPQSLPPPASLYSITNTSGDMEGTDGIESNLPYLEFVPSSHNSAATAHTHAPLSPTASGSHALNMMRTPSANTPLATPGQSPGSSPPHSVAAQHGTAHSTAHSAAHSMPTSGRAEGVSPAGGGVGVSAASATGAVAPQSGLTRGNAMGGTNTAEGDESTQDFLHNTLPTEFLDDGGYGGPGGSDVLLSEIWGSKTNDFSELRTTPTKTDSAISGTPVASLSLAIPSNSPIKPANLSASLTAAQGGEVGGFTSDGNGRPAKPGLLNVPGGLQSPGSLHAESVHGGHASTAASPAQPFTPTPGGVRMHGEATRGSVSGASSDPPSPSPMLAPNAWRPLASVGGLTSTGGATPADSPEFSRRSSVATGGYMHTELRAESVLSPEESLSREPPLTPEASGNGSGGAMHVALLTGMHEAAVIHPSSRDAADSTALSLALEDMEKQFEDEHILSARGYRGQRIIHDAHALQEPPPTRVPASGYYAPHMHAAHASVHPSAHAPSVHSLQSIHSTAEVRVGADVEAGRAGGVQRGSGGAVLRTASQRNTHGPGNHALDSMHMALAGSGMPPRPSSRTSRPASVAGGSSGYPGSHPGSQAGSHPGSHLSSIDLDGLADDQALEEHFLEDSLATLYPAPGLGIDAFLRDHSGGLQGKQAALQSVPVHVVNATQDMLRGGSADSSGLPHAAAAATAGGARRARPASAGTAAAGGRNGSNTARSGRSSAAASGHRRTVSQGAGRGSGMRRGSLTSRPSLGGPSSINSGSVGGISQRPAWGIRNDPSTAAKRASLQSIHSNYSISAHNRSASLRSGASLGASLHSTHSTRSRSALNSDRSASLGATTVGGDRGRQGSVGGSSALPKTPMSARVPTSSSMAASQRARAGAKLAASHAGRGPSFGAPPGRGGRGRGRRPATARPASSSPSPLKESSSLSASHGGGVTHSVYSSGAGQHTKLPSRSGLAGLGQKLQTGTSAASIRSTASGSSRIAAVPAHGMSAAGAPATARAGAGAPGAKSASAAASATGTAPAAAAGGINSNSSSAVPLRHPSSRTNGTTSAHNSDAIFASLDHSNAADNLSDVFSSELPNSPTGLSDHFASATANPFLPMFPAALGVNGLVPDTDNELRSENNTFTPPVGEIFQNVPEQNDPQKLSHSASQFVRGKLAAGIVSPEPKSAARMHAPTHDAAVPTMHVRQDTDVDDVSQRLANPQPSPMLASSIMKTSLQTTTDSVPSQPPSHASSPPKSRQPSSHPASTTDVKSVKSSAKNSRSPSPRRHVQHHQQQAGAGGGNMSISNSEFSGRRGQSISKPLSTAQSSPTHSQRSVMSAGGSNSALSGRVTMSRRALMAQKEAISHGASHSIRAGSDISHSENLLGASEGTLEGAMSALGGSPEQTMTPTMSGAESMTPSSQRPLLPQQTDLQKSQLGARTEDTSGDNTINDAHAMDVVVSVVGPGGVSVPAPPGPPSADQHTPPTSSPPEESPNVTNPGQNDQEGDKDAAKNALTPPHSIQSTSPSVFESGVKMVTLGDAMSSVGHSEFAAVAVEPSGSKAIPERAGGGQGGSGDPARVSGKKKNPFGAFLCCFAAPKSTATAD